MASIDHESMSPEHSLLWQRIADFQLDDPHAAFPFSARLARENGWTGTHARAVVEEYKRFAFLCMTSGHVVCPSEEVDQAWHLHLTYTRNYWTEFCGVLGRPLHHEPTKGGRQELEKHVGLYEQTFQSYRHFFQSEPPPDVWPKAEIRFHTGSQSIQVNRRECWILPKRPWRVLSGPQRTRLGIACAALAAVPLAAGAFNPLDLKGPDFLKLYAVCFAVALTAAIILRRVLCSGIASRQGKQLDPTETAFLTGGSGGALWAALARLRQAGAIQFDEKQEAFGPSHVVASGKLPPDASPFERTVYEAASRDAGADIPGLHEYTEMHLGELRAKLEDDGLLVTKRAAAMAANCSMAIMAAVLALGAVKLLVGISRGKPIGFLFFACVASIIVLLVFKRRPYRTAAGERVLKEQRQNYRAKQPDVDSLQPDQLAMMVALYGTGMLANTALSDLHSASVLDQAYLRPDSSSTSFLHGANGGCGHSGCGGDSGGGSGCGGGGGCGGCGGD